MIRPCLSVIVLCCVVASPLPVSAATVIVTPAEEALAEAKELYQRGIGRFETADFAGAIELWTDAYTLVPATENTTEIKSILLFNIATARERAYAIDGELAGLRQALVLLDGYIEVIGELYSDPDKAAMERAEAVERRTEIQKLLAAATESEPEVEAEVEAEPEAEPEPEIQLGSSTSPQPTSTPGRGLVIAGSVLAGVGVAGLGVMTGGLIMGSNANDLSTIEPTDITGRRDLFARGALGNNLAIVGGALGGVSLLAGAVLVGLGVKRQRSAKLETARVAPLLGPGIAGLSVGGRF